MELCTSQAISNLATHHHKLLLPNPNLLSSKPSLLHLRRVPLARSIPGPLSRLRATSEETSRSSYPYATEERDGTVEVKDVSPGEKKVYDNVTSEVVEYESSAEGQTQISEYFENLNLDTEDAYKYLLYGGGALLTLWLASAVVGSIDSIPLFPKLMEVVGLGYTFWFASRYLLFKRSREELFAKFEELKQEVLGSDND
ncbi:hypothetical protein UlMin_038772 [Ulmus minor]